MLINLIDAFHSNSVVQVCGLPPGASPSHLVPVELCSQGFTHHHHLQKSQCQRQHRSDIYPCLLLLLSHRGFSVKFSCSSPHLVDHTPPVVAHHIACLGTSFELQRQQNSRDSIKETLAQWGGRQLSKRQSNNQIFANPRKNCTITRVLFGATHAQREGDEDKAAQMVNCDCATGKWNN